MSLPIEHYEGTCNSCGERITLDHNPSDGVIDKWIDPDGTVGTWIRHPEGEESNCEFYSSRVTLTNPKNQYHYEWAERRLEAAQSSLSCWENYQGDIDPEKVAQYLKIAVEIVDHWDYILKLIWADR